MDFIYPNRVRSILLEAGPRNKKPYDPNEDTDDDDNTDYTADADVSMTDDTVDIDNALDNALSDNPKNPEEEDISDTGNTDDEGPNIDDALDNALSDNPENPNPDGEDMGDEDVDNGDMQNELDKQINNNDNTGMRKYNLLKDFLALHQTLKTSIDAVKENKSTDENQLIIYTKVVNNLTLLKDYLYRYVMYNFDRNTYVKNLTMYNYFIAGLSLNVNLLKDASDIITIV